MSVIYVGSIYPTGTIEELKKMGSSIDFAAETFQISLLQGLCTYYPNLKIITAPNISTYPRIKKVRFTRETFLLPFSKIEHLFTGFLNIVGVKHLSKIFRIRNAIKQSLDMGMDNIIIVYGVHSPFLLALCGIRKSCYKSCLIVPDLPEFMSGNTNLFYLWGKKIDGWLIRMGLKNIDSYVLFSPYMKEKLPINNKPWGQVEGIFCDDTEIGIIKKEYAYKTILYTGTLDPRYGILDLLEAFNLIKNSDYRLQICGGGGALTNIEEYQKKDHRIAYLGLLSKKEVRILQKKATLLINPRHSMDEYTKYSFPSKTMEYMASGTPTLMSPLASIPDEYRPHLYFFEDESVEGIKNKMIEICEKPQSELEAFGRAASEFILNQKNEKMQAKKIVNLISSIR